MHCRLKSVCNTHYLLYYYQFVHENIFFKLALGFNKVVYNVFNDSKVVIIIKQTGFNTNPKGLKI